jgi:hypothetical protein
MKTIFTLVVVAFLFSPAWAQNSDKINPTLLLKTNQFQNELLKLSNASNLNSERNIVNKSIDNQVNDKGKIFYTFQKNATTLVKEIYQKRHFLNNVNAKYFKVESLLLSEASLVGNKKINEGLSVATTNIWHLADYYFSAENRTTFLIKFELEMNIENIKDDFNETAYNIEIGNISMWKKEIKLSTEERNNLKSNRQLYENQVSNFPETAGEILLDAPKFDQLRDSADIYVVATQEASLLLSGRLKNVYSPLIVDGKQITLEKEGGFSLSLPLNLEIGKERKIIFQITENQYAIQKEIWVQRTSDGLVMRGESNSSAPTSTSSPAKYYALFIAVEDYDNESMKLKYPITDAEKLKNALVEYYTFQDENITFLKNPTRNEIIGALDALTKNINDQSKDGKDANINLLIFYAGHGYLDNDLKRGFWFPKDAQPIGQGGRANWFSNGDLRDYVGGMKTQHTLVIVDACFAGSLILEERDLRMSKEIRNIYELQSRKAMMSGALTTVPDKSAFLENLVLGLTTYAKEKSKQRYFDAASLFYDIKPKVTKNIMYSSRQNPVYGAMVGTGDKLGDFIFTIK